MKPLTLGASCKKKLLENRVKTCRETKETTQLIDLTSLQHCPSIASIMFIIMNAMSFCNEYEIRVRCSKDSSKNKIKVLIIAKTQSNAFQTVPNDMLTYHGVPYLRGFY